MRWPELPDVPTMAESGFPQIRVKFSAISAAACCNHAPD
jgi:hypothetical protein